MESLVEMAAPVGELLKKRGETIAVAESAAGGLISAALLALPGASAYFRAGGVIYTAQAREALLGVEAADMEGLRSSTVPYARLMAGRIRERLATDWALAETGAAGPTGNRYGDAPGHACIAVVGARERVLTLETGREDREENMWAFTRAALDLLAQVLRAEEMPPQNEG